MSQANLTGVNFFRADLRRADLTGVTWSDKDRPTTPKGGTGFGVQLLDRWIRDHHES